MSSCWEYSNIDNLDFDKTWNTVKEIILRNFAGDVVEGKASPSVQNTIYLSQQDILKEIDQVNISQPIRNPFTSCKLQLQLQKYVSSDKHFLIKKKLLYLFLRLPPSTSKCPISTIIHSIFRNSRKSSRV